MNTIHLKYWNIIITAFILVIFSHTAAYSQYKHKRWRSFKRIQKKAPSKTPPKTYASPRSQYNGTKETPFSKLNRQMVRDSLVLQLNNPPVIEVKEIVDFMSQGKRPGIQATIPTANATVVMSNWKKFLKTFGKRHKHRINEIFSDDMLISSISENTFDMYSSLEPYPGGVFLQVFVDLGGAFLSSKKHTQEQEVLLNILKDFAITESVRAIEKNLKIEEKRLLQLDSERETLKIDEINLMEQLKKYQEAVEKIEAGINLNRKLQQRKNIETEKQIHDIEQLRFNLKSVITNN